MHYCLFSSITAGCSVMVFGFVLASIILSVSEVVEGVIELPQNLSIPAVFFFGDSNGDQGNNNYINTLIKCNFPPYGKDFNGGIPTGRFSNAKTPPDLVASELGVSDTIPAYLDPSIQNKDLIKGVSFASGGSGFDPETPLLVSVASLQGQIEMFKEYIRKLKGIVGEERANKILVNALFMVVAGTDDLTNTYFAIGLRRWYYNIDNYTDLMVAQASKLVQELYRLGARRIGVHGIPPIGCVPSLRTIGGGFLRICSEEHNQAALKFNEKLYSKLESVGSSLPESRVIYMDVYYHLLEIIQNPSNYGFEVVNRGCCGTGSIEVSLLCNQLTAVCSDDTKYLFWDSYHLTERGYSIMVHQILQKYITGFL